MVFGYLSISPFSCRALTYREYLYRKKGDHDLAYLFAKQGAKIPYPKNDILFISHPVYDYQFDEEISIADFYTQFKDEGFAAADRLVLNKNVPEEIKEQTYRNILFFIQKISLITNFNPFSLNFL